MREIVVAMVPGIMLWGASVIGLLQARSSGKRPTRRALAWAFLTLGLVGLGPGVVLFAKALVANRPDLAVVVALIAAIWMTPFALAAIYALRFRWPSDARPR